MADIEMPWLEQIVAPAKPWLVTNTMPPIPAEAEAPPDLVTPPTARAAASASRAPFQNCDRRHVGIELVELGKVVGQQRRVGEPGEGVLGRRARHGERAFRQLIDAVAFDVVG